MAKKESSFTNMLLTLLIITLLSSSALGYVFKITKDPIAKAEEYKKNLAMNIILDNYDSIPGKSIQHVQLGTDDVVCYKAFKDGHLIGIAVQSASSGYGGPIRLMVGFYPDGSIKEIAVLGCQETAGLGDKILKSKSNWSTQFEGINPGSFHLQVKKDGGDVDAISASTISSRAYCKAVQKAYDAFKMAIANEK